MTTSPAPRILMCRPKHFAVTYAINPWMDPAGWAAQGRSLTASARLEWERLHHALLGLGATIELLPPVPDLPDLVFTANAAIVMDRKALLARFRHAERRREQPYFERAFREHKARGYIDSIVPLPEGIVLEGAGDCVWDATRGLFWMGYGPRSALAAREVVEETFGLETLALDLADPRFYHMDTALSALSKGEVMYFPGAFTAAGLAEIRTRVAPRQRIELDEEDAVRLAANAVCLGDAIVLSECSIGLRRRLEARGYRVVSTPLTSFLRSGGSAFCLTLRLDRSRASADAQPGRPWRAA
ncbi:MAG TPA: arginine deiminase-related protein [Stellaceae bacterium]|nr:arginine deiminase-related protein [Stellaceae bacterium]